MEGRQEEGKEKVERQGVLEALQKLQELQKDRKDLKLNKEEVGLTLICVLFSHDGNTHI